MAFRTLTFVEISNSVKYRKSGLATEHVRAKHTRHMDTYVVVYSDTGLLTKMRFRLRFFRSSWQQML